MGEPKKKLIVIAGPTAVGKTSFAIKLAQALNTEIISADSRQFYKEISIGTAKPTPEELALIPHHLISSLSINEYYNVSKFENEVLALLKKLFLKYDTVVMVGGSGLYIDAVCQGIDELPDADEKLRLELNNSFNEKGLEFLLMELKKLDPDYFEVVDKSNPKRVLRALEVIKETGRTYTELRKNLKKKRSFEIQKFCLNRDREELFERISIRVDQMLAEGLLDEVKQQIPNRNLNSLNTVGYKEIFKYLDGELSLEQAITDLKTNTRRYAKRQLTWFKRDDSYTWVHPNEIAKVIESI